MCAAPQVVEDRRRAEESKFAETKDAVLEDSDYDSSGDDGDKYHVDTEYETKKRQRRKDRKRDYLQQRVYGYERPEMWVPLCAFVYQCTRVW